MNCPCCNSDRVKRNGRDRHRRQVYKCNECDRTFTPTSDPSDTGGGRKPKDPDITAIAEKYGINRSAAKMRIQNRIRKGMSRDEAIKDLLKTS